MILLSLLFYLSNCATVVILVQCCASISGRPELRILVTIEFFQVGMFEDLKLMIELNASL